MWTALGNEIGRWAWGKTCTHSSKSFSAGVQSLGRLPLLGTSNSPRPLPNLGTHKLQLASLIVTHTSLHLPDFRRGQSPQKAPGFLLIKSQNQTPVLRLLISLATGTPLKGRTIFLMLQKLISQWFSSFPTFLISFVYLGLLNVRVWFCLNVGYTLTPLAHQWFNIVFPIRMALLGPLGG